ncbi:MULTISPECIES: sigma factor [Rhodanobacter]|uniref:sigma factor n=1 Tax=Rhodanobacter TaxID=75309 RepID=UPI000401F55F
MDPQTAPFQQHRQRPSGLAYRMLGAPGDAGDVLHDAWLRWHAQDVQALDDPEAWLVTVTTRIAPGGDRDQQLEPRRHPVARGAGQLSTGEAPTRG